MADVLPKNDRGLKRLAKLWGGLIVRGRGIEVRYDGNGKKIGTRKLNRRAK